MAKDALKEQSSLEEQVYPIDYSPALLTAVTVTSVACTHTLPNGSTASDVTATVVTPIAYVKVPSGLAVGTHYVSCVATTSNADLSPEVRLVVRVDY